MPQGLARHITHQSVRAKAPAAGTAGKDGRISVQPAARMPAAIAAMALDKPAIVGAVHATDLLKSGTTVKLDGERGAVFSAHAISNSGHYPVETPISV